MGKQGVDLCDDAPWSTGAPSGHSFARSFRPASWKSLFLVAATGALVGAVLGCLGWFLPSPGGSLIAPTLVVVGIGAAIGVLGVAFAFLTSRRVEAVVFACTVLLLTLLASAWTFQLSLPARMPWDSSATPRARSILFGVNHGDMKPTMSSEPCTDVTTGSVGPLGAPYRACTWWAGRDHGVTFTKLEPSSKDRRGVSFTDLGARTFLDECYRHLVGPWYMFRSADLADSSSPCPIGYEFHGGP